ncbi:MAG: PAS domain S-box protein [Thermoplasmatota archaeon]
MDILMVDDEKSLLEQAKIFLEREKEQFEIDTAISAQKALGKFDERQYDAVVSDYQMPVMDGLEFLKTIRKEKNDDIPFIIFTGKGREEVAMEALNIGADRYLQKGGSPRSQYDVLAEAIVQEVEHYKTQKALDISEKRYQSITEDVMDNSDVAIFILDSDFNIAWLNSSAEEYFGINKEEVIGRDKEQIINEKIKHIFERRERYENKVTSNLEDNNSIEEFDCHILESERVDERWLKHWSKPIETGLYEGGRMEHYTDITEKIERERKLEENKNWLSQVIKGSSVPTFVLNEDHKVTHWNRACENLTGIDKEDIIGKKDPWKAFYSEERPVMADLILENAVEKRIERYYEDKYRKSDLLEDSYEAEDLFAGFGENGKWVYFTAAPIEDSEGNIIGAIETLQDVTERKKREKEKREIRKRLQEAVNRFRKITEISPYSVILVEKENGKIKDMNKAAENLLKKDRDKIIREKYLELHPEEEREKINEAINGKTYDRLTFSEEFNIIDRAGNKVPVEIKASSLKLGEDEIVYFALNNISQRKKMRDKEDFLHSVLRHDMRNKTQVIYGYLELLEKYDLPDEAEEYISKAMNAADDGLEIINKVKMMRDLREGEEIKEVELCTLIEKVIESNQDVFERKKIRIDCSDKGIKAKGGPLLEELFSNLIENAIKHANCDLLRISAEELEESVIVSFEDDGKGMSDYVKSKIFEKGFKSGDNAGTGLGLYIADSIAKSYDGEIKVKDSDLGGARFDVLFKKYRD